jgi:hypothetical protein
MKRHDTTYEPSRAARAGLAMVAGAMPLVGMLRNPGAMMRSPHVSD